MRESIEKEIDVEKVYRFLDTLYKDDLKRIGFSKEGKLNRPQIQLGYLQL